MSPSPSSPPRSEAEQVVLLSKELEWSRLKIQALKERLRLEMIRKYGAKSEKPSQRKGSSSGKPTRAAARRIPGNKNNE